MMTTVIWSHVFNLSLAEACQAYAASGILYFCNVFLNVSRHVFNILNVFKFCLERSDFYIYAKNWGRGIKPPPLMRHLAILIDNISMFLRLSNGNHGGGYLGKRSRG